MPAIHLVRHGQASFGLGDYDRLSDHGRVQARAVGGELRRRGVAIGSLVHGELRRQRETAEELLAGYAGAAGPARGPDPVPTVDHRWDEFDHEELLQRLEGRARRRAALVVEVARNRRPAEAFQATLEAALRQWADAEHDGYGESFLAFAARSRAALDAVAEAPPAEGAAVVVSSAGTISAVCAGILGLPAEGWLALNRVIVNTGITTVVSGRRGLSLVSFNEHGHLQGPGRPGRTTR
jgi:broad specificity phosphatase PhoE